MPSSNLNSTQHEMPMTLSLWKVLVVITNTSILMLNYWYNYLSLVMHQIPCTPMSFLKSTWRGWKKLMRLEVDMVLWGQYSFYQIYEVSFAAIDSVTLLVPLKVPVWVETGRSSEEHPANSHHCCQCQNALQTGATGILHISNYSVMKVEISKCNLCTTGVYPGKVLLNRSGVSQWDTGCHTSGWVSSDWGTSGWPQPYPRWPHGHAVRVLQQNG